MTEGPISAHEFATLIEMIGGDAPEVVVDLLDTFLDESVKLVNTIVDAHAAGDQATMLRPAHSLKSSSASVGAIRLSLLCADLESYLRGSSYSLEMDKQVAAIQAEFALVQAALEVEIEQLLNT
jgi:HPt (histidine-containing phosphotransfer) domain-containing protein